MICARSSTAAAERPRRAWLLLGACAAATLFATPSFAQTEDQAAAEKLFREGRALLEHGQYEAACPKLAESQRLDPASGTMLALAACHEAQGKTASAWGEYTSAVALARRDGNPRREKAAAQRAAELEPKLSYVTFDVAPATAALSGLELRRDGVLIGSAGWRDVPTDPGRHGLEVTAPHHRRFSVEFDVAGRSTTVRVPELEVEKASVAPIGQPPPAPPPSSGPSLRDMGIVLGAAGVVSIGVGSVFGAMAINGSKDAKAACPNPMACTNAGAVTENDHAKTYADVSTVTMIAGIAGVVGGVVMFVVGHPTPETPHLEMGGGPGDLGLSVRGRF